MPVSLKKTIMITAALLVASVPLASARLGETEDRELHKNSGKSKHMSSSTKAAISLKKEIEGLKKDVSQMKRGIKKHVVKNSKNHGKVSTTDHHLFSNRIVGGNQAGAGFDWFVNYGEFCGASLIHPRVVLSAAHCDGPGSIRIGSNDFTSGGITRSISRRIKHPQYDDATTDNDYLLILLDEPVTGITPVALNSDASQPQNNEDLTVIGFGATSEGGSGSDKLLKVVVPVVPHNTCAQQYDGLNKNIHLCAGFAQGGKDSCQGDSGGPIVEYRGTTPVQVGVVSFGNGCAQPNASGVYARVSGAYDWIQQTVCDLTKDCSPGLTPGPIAAPAPAPTSSGGGGGDNSPTFDMSPEASPTEGSPTFDMSPEASPTNWDGWSPTTDDSTDDWSWNDDGNWDDDWSNDDGNWDDDGSWWNRALGVEQKKPTSTQQHKKRAAAKNKATR